MEHYCERFSSSLTLRNVLPAFDADMGPLLHCLWYFKLVLLIFWNNVNVVGEYRAEDRPLDRADLNVALEV